MALHHIQLSSWESTTKSFTIRSPTRKPNLQQSTFEDEFDYTTLIYDLFSDNQGKMVMISPPEDNFSTHLTGARIRDLASGESLAYEKVSVDRVTYLEFESSVNAIEILSDCGRTILVTQPNLSRIFDGRNLVFTMQKNNPLTWIADWAYFYIQYHQANAFLIYDNGSENYDLTDVYHTIQGLGEDLEVIVVDWPFKYGPAPTVAGDFEAVWSQRAALNHARLRFMGQVGACLNVDIDEYAWCEDEGSVFNWFKSIPDDFTFLPGFKGMMNKQKKSRTVRDLSYLGARDKMKWMCKASFVGDSYWQPHTVTELNPETDEYEVKSRVRASQNGLYFHLRGLRTLDTNRKMRSPKNELKEERKNKNMKSKRKSLRKQLLTMVLEFRIKWTNSGKAGLELARREFDDLDYPERPEIEPIFCSFREKVRNLKTPGGHIPSGRNSLEERLWAGKLFYRGDLGAAESRMESLISQEGDKPSYLRFLKLIRSFLKPQ